MKDLKFLLGMNWFFSNYILINCDHKTQEDISAVSL